MKSKVRRIGAALGVIALAAALPALADSSTPTTVVTVDQGSFSTAPVSTAAWSQSYDETHGAGTAELVAGPLTAPLGSGSLRLATSTTNDVAQVAGSGFSTTKLSSFEGVKYSSFVDEDSEDGAVQITLKIAMSDTTLVYEPYMAYGNGPASIQGAWQTWDAVAGGNGKGWWATRNYAACGQGTPCTFSQIKALVDPAGAKTISGVQVGAGSGIAKFDGNVDDIDLTISGWRTRFNFESNKVNADVVTRVTEKSTAGWTSEGTNGTGATNSADNAYSVGYVAGPDFPGQSGAGSIAMKHGGVGGYSAIKQDYAEGNADVTQRYLGSLDNVYLQTYRLTGTKGDFPAMRFEVRIPDPTGGFAFTSIVNDPGVIADNAIVKTDGIHGASTSADRSAWWLTNSVAGLNANQMYTWDQVMRSDLKGAVITKALVGAGSSVGNGVFSGGVDLLRFEYRDGSSKTWDFEKFGVNPTTTTAAPTTTSSTSSTVVTAPGPDTAVPSVKITTKDRTSFLPGSVVKLDGTASDADSGLDKIGVEFVGPLGIVRVGYFGTCTGCAAGPNNSATWSVTPTAALLPGVYTATAYAHDLAGNVGISNPITIVVAG